MSCFFQEPVRPEDTLMHTQVTYMHGRQTWIHPAQIHLLIQGACFGVFLPSVFQIVKESDADIHVRCKSAWHDNNTWRASTRLRDYIVTESAHTYDMKLMLASEHTAIQPCHTHIHTSDTSFHRFHIAFILVHYLVAMWCCHLLFSNTSNCCCSQISLVHVVMMWPWHADLFSASRLEVLGGRSTSWCMLMIGIFISSSPLCFRCLLL